MSVEQIIIEGDVARHVRVETLSESPLAGLAPFLTTRLATTLPILPQRPVRHLSFDPEAGTGVLLVETRPQRHIIQVRHRADQYAEDAARGDTEQIARFNVQLPYQYFGYQFTMSAPGTGALVDFAIVNSYLFWAKTAIRTPEDRLYVAACPNVNTNGSICWGSTQSDSSSLSARLDDLVNNFFTTTFNEDLGHRSPFGTSMTEWENHSEDPLEYLRWDYWHNAPQTTVGDIEQYIAGVPAINRAELDPTYLRIPELPGNFTVARAQEWLSTLDPGAHRRLMAAIRTVAEPDPEQTTEEVEA